MSAITGSVLVVDDEPNMRNYLRTVLELKPCRVETADSGAAAIQHLEKGFAPDLILLDVAMPGLDGLDTLQDIRRRAPKTKVVMMSCHADAKKVVRAMQLGALDYMAKPFSDEDLDSVLAKCFSGKKAARTQDNVENEVVDLGDGMIFVCASASMKAIRSQATLVAGCDIPVLLLGESGTGKEVVATLIHKLSPRANRPFLKVNCAAVPSELLESELFGYEAGAFTGATKSKPGKFEICNGGTILLDEIGEMPAPLQAKLLHVLQDNEFSRLGGRSTTRVDVRVLAATNVNVQEAIASKRLRADLYYRLNGLSLRLPPLRERKEEIPVLFKHFVTRIADRFARQVPPISSRLMQACLTYSWPGNLRELQNFVKRYVVLGDEQMALAELTGTDAPFPVAPSKPVVGQSALKCLVKSVKNEAEAVAIADALQQTNWRRKQAASLLGISYKALLYKIRQYEIQPPPTT